MASPTSGDYHWRWVGPKRIEGHGTKRVERVVAEAIGAYLPAGVAFWCADETPFTCVNPAHAVPVGSLPTADTSELFGDCDEGSAAVQSQGYNIVLPRAEEAMGQALRRLDDPCAPSFADAGTRWLLDHGFDAYGEPVKSKS
jgi:hypothetical protein